MKKQDLVKGVLLRQNIDRIPLFMSSTPQFLTRALERQGKVMNTANYFQYCVDLGFDVFQIGHPSFYPVKVMELGQGAKYSDEFGRTHIISGYYDNFCAPFPLQSTTKLDLHELEAKWKSYTFPNPLDPKWYHALDEAVVLNSKLHDPLSLWGVINGPFEPTWQLLSDGWPNFFILARRKPGLAHEIINRVTDYCIAAGQEMIRRGVHAIRIGDDYALNEGLMCSPDMWYKFIFPAHKRLIDGLKNAGGLDFPVILHSDGNITAIFQWLCESGIDGINPIQPDALDFESVVKIIGNHLCFVGVFDLRYFLKQIGRAHV